MKLEDKVCASDDVVAKEVGGEIVLLDLASGTYFGLNEVGGRIWQMIDGQSCTLAQIYAVIEAEYDAEAQQVRADVMTLLDELRQRQLITVDQQ